MRSVILGSRSIYPIYSSVAFFHREKISPNNKYCQSKATAVPERFFLIRHEALYASNAEAVEQTPLVSSVVTVNHQAEIPYNFA
jgi:hypothetical protein